MPIYEYACEQCEHQFETLQKMSEDPLKKCPECGEDALRKLISKVAFRLKGSGWYETDFKEDKQRNLSNKDDKKPESDKGDSSGEKAESAGGKTEKGGEKTTSSEIKSSGSSKQAPGGSESATNKTSSKSKNSGGSTGKQPVS